MKFFYRGKALLTCVLLFVSVLIISENGLKGAEFSASQGQMPIAAGWKHTVGIRSDGTVIAAGDNSEKQCETTEWRNVIDIAGGDNFTLGLRSDGRVLASGSNSQGDSVAGQLDVSKWIDIIDIETGFYHSIGLRSNGTVIATGSNAYHQCNVSEWSEVVAITGGGWHTVGLKSDGTVVAVGRNNAGQLNVEDWRNVIAVVGGGWHTVGLKSDGTVVAVGRNNEGQLNVENWRNIVAVAAGAYHTVGLKSDGTVIAVGSNDYSNAKLLSTGQMNVSSWRNIIAITAGDYHTIGLKSDGSVVAAGWNDFKQVNVSKWIDIGKGYTASGKVTDDNGKGLGGFIVTAANKTAITDEDGRYIVGGLYGETIITASKEGYVSSTKYRISRPDSNLNFIGRYIIVGKVADVSGTGIESVIVAAGEKIVTSGKDGQFIIEGLSGKVKVLAEKEGYTFLPVEVVIEGPKRDISYVALYEARGYVRDEDGNGLEGIAVAAGNKKTTTDNNGLFVLTSLSGQEEMTFKKEGYTFEPASKVVTGPVGNLTVKGTAPPPPVIYSYTPTYNIERVTRDGAPKANPRLSPNGQMLAFASAQISVQGSYEWSIYALRFGQQGTIDVSRRPGTIQPTWMPNSERLVYVHLSLADKPLLVSQSYKGGSISFISLIPIGDNNQYPDISTDGDRIVFQTKMQNKDYILTMNVDGSSQRLITEGIQPQWHPTSSSVLFARKVGIFCHITLLDEQGVMSQLTQGEYDNLFPSWSPDGKKVAFVSKMDGRWHLYVMNTDGTNLTQLTKGEAEAFYCDWGTDGWIYFVSDAGSPSYKTRDPWSWTYSDIWKVQPGN